jgi:hypothetical protein
LFLNTESDTKLNQLDLSPALATRSCAARAFTKGPLSKQGGSPGNSLFKFKSLNELKKDQTKIKIFKNSSFDSSFNTVQSLNSNLSHLLLAQAHPNSKGQQSSVLYTKPNLGVALRVAAGSKNDFRMRRVGSYPKFSAILRAIRSIRLNKDEWKLIRYLNQIKKKFNNKKEGLACARGGVFTKLNPTLSPLATLPLGGLAHRVLPKAGSHRPLLAFDDSPIRGTRAPSATKSRDSLLRSKSEETKKLRELKKELKKFARLLPIATRGADAAHAGVETPLLNKITPSRPTRLSLLQMRGRKARVAPSPIRGERGYNKIFSYNNIISKNILLRNMKFNFLKSTLSTILKKRIRLMSEILEDKPIKHYSLYSYLKFCIFSPPHLKGGKTKLSLNKYKGRKLGSFIKYNQIIGYNFNSPLAFGDRTVAVALQTKDKDPRSSAARASIGYGKILNIYNKFNKIKNVFALVPALAASAPSLLAARVAKGEGGTRSKLSRLEGEEAGIGNIYIKDTYKLLFYLFKSMYCLISKPVLNYTNDKITIQLFYYLNIPKKKVFRLFSISYINSIKKKWLAPPRTPILPKGWNDGLYPNLPPSKREALLAQTQGVGGETKGREAANQKFTGGWAFLNTLLQSKPEGSNISPITLLRAKGRSKGVGRGNTKIYIRWKLRKAISRLKFKIITGKNLLFNLRKFNLTKVYQNKFKLICAILSNKFNKPVELQLIRLHHPYHDSNILVNLLSLNIKNKRKKARVAIQKIYNKNPVKFLNDPKLKKPALPSLMGESLNPFSLPKAGANTANAANAGRGTGKLIPAFLSGLNIKIAGRLMGEPIIPRITTKVFSKGATATGKVNYLDVARVTKKNRKGAYTIKITSGQNFF